MVDGQGPLRQVAQPVGEEQQYGQEGGQQAGQRANGELLQPREGGEPEQGIADQGGEQCQTQPRQQVGAGLRRCFVAMQAPLAQEVDGVVDGDAYEA